MKLSKYFTLAEAEHSDTAVRESIHNKLVAPQHIINAVHLAMHVLDPVREHFGPFSPNSWYRCYKLNGLVGGSSSSDHLRGAAADIELKSVDNLKLAEWIHDYLAFDQLILECYEDGVPTSGWVHVSYRLGQNRKRTMTYAPGTEKVWRHGLP